MQTVETIFIIIFGILFLGIAIALMLLIADSKGRVRRFKEMAKENSGDEIVSKILSASKVVSGNDPAGKQNVSYAVWVSSVERDKSLFEMEQKIADLRKELEEVKLRDVKRQSS